jgi:hypothetical protein
MQTSNERAWIWNIVCSTKDSQKGQDCSISMTTMLELVESGTTTLVLELATLVKTSSNEPSMEFRISTAWGMPVRKIQTLKYVSNMLFLVLIVGHTNWLGTFSIALVFILFQLAEKSYLAAVT